MKGKKILALASIFAGAVLVGTTFAASAWAVTDNAGTKTIKISGEKINASDDTYYVTLEYGENTGLTDVANLEAGTLRYAGKAGLVATYTGANSYNGLLSLSMIQPGARATGANLIDYVKVYVYDEDFEYNATTKVIDAEDLPEKDPLITVQKTAANGSSSIAMTTKTEKVVYFVVEMVSTGIDASILNTIKADVIEVAVNWDHDTDGQSTVSAIPLLYKPSGVYNNEVYCFAWKGKVPNAEYPGVKMTLEEDGVYSYALNLANFDSFILSYTSTGEGHPNVKAREADFIVATEMGLDNNALSTSNNYWTGTGWGARPAANPSLVSDYYIVGSMTSWACDENYALAPTETKDDSNVNVTYKRDNVSLTAGTTIKVRNNSNLADEEWYWNANTYENCHYTLDYEGNLVIADSGTYTVTLYRTSNANNCVILTNFVAA